MWATTMPTCEIIPGMRFWKLLRVLVYAGPVKQNAFVCNIFYTQPWMKVSGENNQTYNIQAAHGNSFQQLFWNDHNAVEGNHVVHLSVFFQLVDSHRNAMHHMSTSIAASLCIEYVWLQMQTLSMSARVQKTFDWMQDPHHHKCDTMDDV